MTDPNGIEYIMPDDFTIEQTLKSFGNQLLAQSSSYEDGDEIVLSFDREVLLGLGAMLLRYLNRNQEDPS
jgi:hypothetical protein